MNQNPKLLVLTIFLFIIFLNTGCKKKNIKEENTTYSFFVAGHTYGTPGSTDLGLYKDFKEKFPYILSFSNMQLGVLTGDIVKAPSIESWDAVDEDIEDLGLYTFFAVGNHDMYDRNLFESRYGPTYYDTIINTDLFIILDPNIDRWNISGEQLSFLEQSVNSNSTAVDNIFVFFHQLLWIENPKYKNVKPNSLEGKADTINFWSEVEPIFNNLNNSVFMFAGDVGAAYWSDDFMYDCYDNITFIASGMGEGIGDNFIIVSVDEYKNVTNKLIALQGDINSLGNIEDYVLP
ncbi:MAG: metallophosphoesterase [Bacteroidales bacterium]|nr:metallophosphoesterase [Bacteroidales bacterium]